MYKKNLKKKQKILSKTGEKKLRKCLKEKIHQILQISAKTRKFFNFIQ